MEKNLFGDGEIRVSLELSLFENLNSLRERESVSRTVFLTERDVYVRSSFLPIGIVRDLYRVFNSKSQPYLTFPATGEERRKIESSNLEESKDCLSLLLREMLIANAKHLHASVQA